MRCKSCTAVWRNLEEGDPCPSCEEDEFDSAPTKEMNAIELLALKQRAAREVVSN